MSSQENRDEEEQERLSFCVEEKPQMQEREREKEL